LAFERQIIFLAPYLGILSATGILLEASGNQVVEVGAQLDKSCSKLKQRLYHRALLQAAYE